MAGVGADAKMSQTKFLIHFHFTKKNLPHFLKQGEKLDKVLG
jgi:hypothetical protein